MSRKRVVTVEFVFEFWRIVDDDTVIETITRVDFTRYGTECSENYLLPLRTSFSRRNLVNDESDDSDDNYKSTDNNYYGDYLRCVYTHKHTHITSQHSSTTTLLEHVWFQAALWKMCIAPMASICFQHCESPKSYLFPFLAFLPLLSPFFLLPSFSPSIRSRSQHYY